uniref:Ovule protein n=1 Tax=Caenorhabditis tropicalis TaxID=1561998 RepID=A0A1I7TX74_9PELO
MEALSSSIRTLKTNCFLEMNKDSNINDSLIFHASFLVTIESKAPDPSPSDIFLFSFLLYFPFLFHKFSYGKREESDEICMMVPFS